ncbi:dTDP-glucose 4,6-dehydratase, partial [Candidatus Woesearchaeota archaeon]
MVKYLITGGAGFIGSNFIRYILSKERDCHVLNVDKLTYAGNLGNLRDVEQDDRYEFVKCDIVDDEFGKIVKEYRPDILLNFAAATHIDRSIRYPKEFVLTDVVGAFNVAYTVLKNNVKVAIHISTDEIYGSIIGKSVKEDAKLDPTSPYSASKASADLLLLSYLKTYKLPLIIVRPCNNYGRNQYPEKLVSLSIVRLLSDKPVILHGEGKEIREWIHVSDCCRALYGIVKKGRIGEIYNLGSGIRFTNMNMITMIMEEMFGRVYVNMIKKIPNRPGNDKGYAIDSSKLVSLIGDYVTIPIRQGLRMTIDWYR